MKLVAIVTAIVFLIANSVEAKGLSSLPQKIPGPGVKTFIFSPQSHRWAVYDASGNRLSTGVANGGSHYCRDIKRSCRTPTGTFRLQHKRGGECRSTRYPIKRVGGRIVRGGAHMPYCMFFTNYHAIHGYAHLTNANVSHGCIRISTSAARVLYGQLPIGSKVIILSY